MSVFLITGSERKATKKELQEMKIQAKFKNINLIMPEQGIESSDQLDNELAAKIKTYEEKLAELKM